MSATPKQIQVAIILMNRDRPELADAVYERVQTFAPDIRKTCYVIEAGSNKQTGCSKYMTHWFRDPDYRGRYYAFNQGLKHVMADEEKGGFRYDYVWFLVNDIIFPEGQDTLTELVAVMEENPTLAQFAPGEPGVDDYHGCEPKPGRRWHKASTIHGLAILMSRKAIEEVGYCNPVFHYSQGAGTELAYLLYKSGWCIGYSDVVTLEHAGGSTYGKVTKISRHEYQRRARKFASTYLAEHYGENWDELFATVLPPDVETNNYPWQKDVWNKELPQEKRFQWFWKAGSFVKRKILRIGSKEVA
mgnify:CR=1 FL=1